MWIYDFAFCCKFGKMSQIHVFRGVRPDYYDITQGGYQNLLQYYMEGGLPNLLQYYNGGGSLGTPNLYYVIYGRPLTDLLLKTRDP